MTLERFSCRIYGVLIENGRVLMTRSLFKGKEFVNYPGGGVELGEAPGAALKREFKEETGLDIEPVRALYSSEGAHLSTQMPIQIVGAYWLVRKSGGELNSGGNDDDVKALFWAPVEAVPTAEMFPSDREFTEKLGSLL